MYRKRGRDGGREEEPRTPRRVSGGPRESPRSVVQTRTSTRTTGRSGGSRGGDTVLLEGVPGRTGTDEGLVPKELGDPETGERTGTRTTQRSRELTLRTPTRTPTVGRWEGGVNVLNGALWRTSKTRSGRRGVVCNPGRGIGRVTRGLFRRVRGPRRPRGRERT